MIAKQIKGKDFYGVLAYNQKKVNTGNAYVLTQNIEEGSVVEMTKEFNHIRQLRPKLSKAVYHVSLNLPHDEKLMDTKFEQLAEDYLLGMGFDDNQYIVYRHLDQNHPHVHIIANRIKLSGEVVSDSSDYRRSERLIRKLEKKYQLSSVVGSAIANKSSLSQAELEKTIRTGEVPIRLFLQTEVKRVIGKSKNTSEFIQNLQLKGIHPKFNISKSTGRVSGISFEYDEIIYKGSTLGRGYSWNSIVKSIDYEQVRDRTIIFQTNTAEQRNVREAFVTREAIQDDTGNSRVVGSRPEKFISKSKHYLEPNQKDDRGLEGYNSFKNELDDGLWKKRRRKGFKR